MHIPKQSAVVYVVGLSNDNICLDPFLKYTFIKQMPSFNVSILTMSRTSAFDSILMHVG